MPADGDDIGMAGSFSLIRYLSLRISASMAWSETLMASSSPQTASIRSCLETTSPACVYNKFSRLNWGTDNGGMSSSSPTQTRRERGSSRSFPLPVAIQPSALIHWQGGIGAQENELLHQGNLDQVSILKKRWLIHLAAVQTAAIFASQVLQKDTLRRDD